MPVINKFNVRRKRETIINVNLKRRAKKFYRGTRGLIVHMLSFYLIRWK